MKIAIIITLMALLGCRKEVVETVVPEPSKYHKIRFIAYIDSIETVDAVALEARRYRPETNITHITEHAFLLSWGTLNDTLKIVPIPTDDSIYVGCTFNFGLNVRFKDDHGDSRGNNYWMLHEGTVVNAKDTTIVFRYPQDTIKAVRLDWTSGQPIP